MSRIEEALNKAVQIAEGKFPPSPGKPDIPLPPPASSDEELVLPKDSMLVTMTSPHSPVAEEYRKLKEAFIKESRRDGFHNVVLVTSANPQEGKTITTLNLAICLAQEFDYTVLVVDADLRAPSCHGYLGIDPGLGLSDCLEGRADCADVLVRTGIGRLVLLPAGTPVANPVELLSSNKMRQFVQELKHRYPDRFILIDSPPANLFAETRFLATLADGAIVVIREGETSLDDVTETARALDHKILGVVYNNAFDSPVRKTHYYSYYMDEQQSAET
jgi:exopolysaccharide/PEP-CTERM locus tyrosine autokinase